MLQFTNKISHSLIQTWKQRVSTRLSPLLTLLWFGGFAVAAFALWGFVELADEVLERETKVVDTAILQTIHLIHSPLLDQIMIGVTFLGNPPVLVYVSICVGVFLLLQRRWAGAIALTIVTSGGIALNVWLKTVFARVRPSLWERLIEVKSYSFPSGHAMFSLVVYGYLGYLLIVSYPYYRHLILFFTVLLITAIGFSRLYLGVHWPTDILAGYSAGLVWLISCILSINIIKALLVKAENNS